MTINELKGDLQELAIKRTKENLAEVGLEFDELDMIIDLSYAFKFSETLEGHKFWSNVNCGKITELLK
jgi:hypothetical protein